MTKREICERLIDLRDQLETGWQRNDVPARELCRDATYDLRDLLLDLAAPEEEPKRETPEAEKKRTIWDDLGKGLSEYLAAEWLKTPNAKPETPKAEEKHPGVIVPVNKKYPATCLKCGGEAEIVDNIFGTSDDWAYCPKCGVSFRLKPGEGEK